ncbi:MAG TPA: HAD family phosphatase [Bryobacteraceae bacterium]|jgi:putative hydrolase of the HAD superfamily|nr:HAD family phosphatase [Bryobacteraceae bacterium]
MPIRAVIFDYGGVVCFHPSKEQIAEAAAVCKVSPEEFVRALWKNRLRYDAGQHPYDYWRETAALMNRALDDAGIEEMIRREIDFWSRFDDRVLGWIERLRASGVRTGILSNLPVPLGARLRSNGLLRHFDQVTFSCELGCTKPDRRIYENALQGLGVLAEEALFIDDRPENVAGARQAGLHAELYTTWENFGDVPARYALPG